MNQYGMKTPHRGSSAELWLLWRELLGRLRGSRGSQAAHRVGADRPTGDPVIGRRARRRARRQFAKRLTERRGISPAGLDS